MTLLLNAEQLQKHYAIKGGMFKPDATVKALNSASFELHAGKTLAVVGESGCGKSTLARVLTRIEAPTNGELKFADGLEGRRDVQMVFQNPYGSLNPRHKIGYILEEPLKLSTNMTAEERRAKVEPLMSRVGLRPEHYERYPHMFSGGQRQRIAVARALVLDPKIVVLDEPVSALDLSIQAQVLNLLLELQQERDLAYVFISHDLSVVKHIADDVMVMYLGNVVEHGPADEIFANPRHPYTRALLSATPVADPTRQHKREILTGELPSPIDPPPGCPFAPRCKYAEARCVAELPALASTGGVKVRCVL
ncbi:MAG: dipeptide ABC transporter ATP-binding protein [Gammaproteobacteria bacterium]|nr:dipeptide ABC transporter ATP-binding protein [Gammaproteobacteria bacterium]